MTVQELIDCLNRIEDKTKTVVLQYYDLDGCADGYEHVYECVCEVAKQYQLGLNKEPIDVIEIR